MCCGQRLARVDLDRKFVLTFLAAGHFGYFRIASFLLYLLASGGLAAEDPSKKFQVLQEFKAILKRKVKAAEVSAVHLEIYPEDPDDLPEALRLQGYVNGEKPSKEGNDLGLATKGYSCRKTNTLVRASSSTSLATCTDANGQATLLQQQMKMMQQMWATWNHGQMDADLDNLEIFPQKASRRQNKKTLPIEEPPRPIEEVPKAVKPVDEEKVHPASAKSLFDLPPMEPTGRSMTEKEQQTVVASAFAEKKRRKKEAVDIGEQELQEPQKENSMPKTLPTKKAKAKPQPKNVSKPVAKQAKPAPPGPGQGTVFYRGGKVHRSDRSCCWRVFLRSSDRCDKKVPWHGSEKTSWSRALALIDESHQ